jgi:hypothetical protein
MKNRVSLKTFILILAALALLLIISGFFYDTRGFVSNILAEITGLFLGIVVAILLVDRFTESQRQKRWERVRVLTHNAIAHHLSNIILELHNHFPLTNHNKVLTTIENNEASYQFSKLQITNIVEQIRQPILMRQIPAESIREYFNSIKWDISQIRLDLMPRVIQSSDNQELIDILIEFDDIVQDLQNNVIIKKHIAEPAVYNNFLLLLEKIKDIYQLL